MNDKEILKAHVKEIWELKAHELMARFDITEEQACNFILVSILLDHAEGKINE